MTKLAEERGPRIMLGSVEDINYKEDAHTAEDTTHTKPQYLCIY
jgi:hypothetical protein